MVRGLVKFGLNAFSSKQTNIFSAAFFIILTTIFGQILGLAKYRLFASMFGDSPELNAFLAASKIPDFLFQVLIAGAMTSVFIPIFTDYISHDKRQQAYRFASTITNIGVVVFIAVSLIVTLFAPQLMHMIAPGFSAEQLALMVNLMRIILIAQIFFILGTVATGILQSFQHFLIPGIASALYNAGIILGLLLFAPGYGVYGAAIGVVIGAILFFVTQLPYLTSSGFSFKLLFDIDDGVKKVFRLMWPRSLTILLAQIVILANTRFASMISDQSLVPLEFALTLMIAPVLLFGQSIAQASFPALSRKVDDRPGFISIFVASFNQILYLTLPISVLFIVLRVPIVRLIYGAKLFNWDATVATGMTLAFFSISLGAQSLIYLLSRAFYSYKNTHTPFVITFVSVVLNVLFSYIFVVVFRMPVYSLALSFSLANIFAVGCMIFYLDRKIHLPKVEILISLIKILIATLTMGFALYIPIKLLDQLVFDTTRTINLIILTGISSFFGILAFVFFTWLLDIKEAYYIIETIRKFNPRSNILRQIGELVEGPKNS